MYNKIEKIVFATGNDGKLSEVRNIFAGTGIEIISPKDIGIYQDVEESGATFLDNALLKAESIRAKTDLPVIADDSGLSVEQLNGQPGVISARYAGENSTYDDNNKKLLYELKNFPSPHSAKFVCCAIYLNGLQKEIAFGELHGEIINNPSGNYGFGYDPIFKPSGYDKTLAELRPEEKNEMSHRAKAFLTLIELIKS